jgi:hypothetical protein
MRLIQCVAWSLVGLSLLVAKTDAASKTTPSHHSRSNSSSSPPKTSTPRSNSSRSHSSSASRTNAHTTRPGNKHSSPTRSTGKSSRSSSHMPTAKANHGSGSNLSHNSSRGPSGNHGGKTGSNSHVAQGGKKSASPKNGGSHIAKNPAHSQHPLNKSPNGSTVKNGQTGPSNHHIAANHPNSKAAHPAHSNPSRLAQSHPNVNPRQVVRNSPVRNPSVGSILANMPGRSTRMAQRSQTGQANGPGHGLQTGIDSAGIGDSPASPPTDARGIVAAGADAQSADSENSMAGGPAGGQASGIAQGSGGESDASPDPSMQPDPSEVADSTGDSATPCVSQADQPLQSTDGFGDQLVDGASTAIGAVTSGLEAAGKEVPVLNALDKTMTVLNAYRENPDNLGRAAVVTGGDLAGGAGGSSGGAYLGGAFCAFVPGGQPFVPVCAVGGAVVGNWAGGNVGRWAAGKGYDATLSGMQSVWNSAISHLPQGTPQPGDYQEGGVIIHDYSRDFFDR